MTRTIFLFLGKGIAIGRMKTPSSPTPSCPSWFRPTPLTLPSDMSACQQFFVVWLWVYVSVWLPNEEPSVPDRRAGVLKLIVPALIVNCWPGIPPAPPSFKRSSVLCKSLWSIPMSVQLELTKAFAKPSLKATSPLTYVPVSYTHLTLPTKRIV